MKVKFEFSLEDAEFDFNGHFVETTEEFCHRNATGDGKRYAFLCLTHSVLRSEFTEALTFVFHPHDEEDAARLAMEAIAAFEQEKFDGLQGPSRN